MCSVYINVFDKQKVVTFFPVLKQHFHDDTYFPRVDSHIKLLGERIIFETNT